MADLSPEEHRFVKSMNAKLKGIGGQITVRWKDGKIATYELTSENTGEAVYKPATLDQPNSLQAELRD